MDVFRINANGCLQETALLSHYFIILISIKDALESKPNHERNTGLYDMYSKRPTFVSKSIWVLQPEHVLLLKTCSNLSTPQTIKSQIQTFYSPYPNPMQTYYNLVTFFATLRMDENRARFILFFSCHLHLAPSHSPNNPTFNTL